MKCFLLWNFCYIKVIRVQISQRRNTILPSSNKYLQFYKTTYQLCLSNWTVCQFLSITVFFSLSSVCVSFSRMLLSAFLVTPDFTDHWILSMPCRNDSLNCSVVYLPIHYLLCDFFLGCLFCDFNCVNNLHLALSKIFC